MSSPAPQPLPEVRHILNHGHVRLVDIMGSDLSVVRNARCSYNADWRTGTDEGSDHRLINYLWRNQHTTPFESVTLTFDIKAPIFVLRQWHRHRTQSYNEISARYSELPNEYYIPDVEQIGTQDTKNRQGRDLTAAPTASVYDLLLQRQEQRAKYDAHCEAAFDLYKDLLANGWPRELARGILPVATYSRMFATMNLLNLFRFLTLRTNAHAQYEIRVYADAMLELIEPFVPTCVGAWRRTQG